MLAKSYHAVGIQEVLAEVDVPKGSFYHYFSSKEDFGVAIVEYYGEKLADYIRRRMGNKELSPRMRMREYFLAIRTYYAENGLEHGCLVAKLATEVADRSPQIRIALQKEFDKWVQLITGCIIEAQEKGEIGLEHEPGALAEFILASWEGGLIRMKVNQDIAPIDNFLEYIFEHVLKPR